MSAPSNPDSTAASTSNHQEHRCIAFVGLQRIAQGTLSEVAAHAKELFDRGMPQPVQVFDAVTSRPIDLDLSGTPEQVLRKLPAVAPAPAPGTAKAPKRRGPGRPKLGVVSKEVTLLPRHWAWLAEQPGGASAALRRLVEQARRSHAGRDRHRQAQEAAYRFLSHIGGDLPGFEELSRALFAGDSDRFESLLDEWPDDVRDHARQLAGRAFRTSASAAAEGEP